MKACRKCSHMRELDGYYKDDNTCKECRKAAVRANYQRNREHYREYERKRANLPHREKARIDYAKTERGRVRTNAAKAAYLERNPLKKLAHRITGNAIRDGKLVRQPCERCGNLKSEAHHDDYSKPLDVRWLCKQHHDEHHEQERMNRRAAP